MALIPNKVKGGYSMVRPRYLVVTCVLIFLSGCSLLQPAQLQPVTEEDITSMFITGPHMRYLSNTPERRLVLVRMPERTFCAEPPAEVAQSLAATMSIVAKGTGQPLEAAAGASIATAVAQLFRRTQGLQFYRDSMFHLCTMYLNGVLRVDPNNLKAEQDLYLTRSKEILETARELINAEIPHFYKNPPPALGSASSPNLPATTLPNLGPANAGQRLDAIEQLKKEGKLSDEDYKAQRKRILDSL